MKIRLHATHADTSETQDAVRECCPSSAVNHDISPCFYGIKLKITNHIGQKNEHFHTIDDTQLLKPNTEHQEAKNLQSEATTAITNECRPSEIYVFVTINMSEIQLVG